MSRSAPFGEEVDSERDAVAVNIPIRIDMEIRLRLYEIILLKFCHSFGPLSCCVKKT